MRIKILSDFHSCFWSVGNINKFERILEKYLPSQPEDAKTTLVCAGDMGTFSTYPNSYKPLFALLSKRFKHVIMIPGNHTYYNTAGICGKEEEFWKDKKIPKNVHYLDDTVKVIDDVAFIGSCLWTSFNDLDPLAMVHAARSMNDFICVKKRNYEVNGVYGTVINSSKLKPEDTVYKHYNSVAFIKKSLELYQSNKCIVVTHHMPSELSVNEKFAGDLLNYAYFTDLSEIMLDWKPLYWVHGHTHDSCDYVIGDTRIICNPLGYHAVQINKKFNPDLVIEV